MLNQNKLTNQVAKQILECSHNALATRQTTNQLAKQIINQATKIKQILLSTSIKLLTLISVLTLNNYLCAMTPSRTDKTKSDRMAELAKRAEDMYAASSAEKAADKVPTPVITPAPKTTTTTTETAKLESDKSEPKALDRTNLDNPLDKHGNITDDFWKELSKCKKCPPRHERIDCKKMLQENPAWQKVVPMDRKTKKVIMNKIHDSLVPVYNSSTATARVAAAKINTLLSCNTICAICANADPDYWITRLSPARSILSSAAVSDDFELFSLLLEKGADHSDASKICHYVTAEQKYWKQQLSELEYNDDYLGELAKYGQKCTKERAELRDGR